MAVKVLGQAAGTSSGVQLYRVGVSTQAQCTAGYVVNRDSASHPYTVAVGANVITPTESGSGTNVVYCKRVIPAGQTHRILQGVQLDRSLSDSVAIVDEDNSGFLDFTLTGIEDAHGTDSLFPYTADAGSIARRFTDANWHANISTITPAVGTILTAFFVCNADSSSHTFSIAVFPADDGNTAHITNAMIVYNAVSIPANTTLEILQGVCLASTGDTVYVKDHDSSGLIVFTGCGLGYGSTVEP